VLELLCINVGYQAHVLRHPAVAPSKTSYRYAFTQTAYFGSETTLPDGSKLPPSYSVPRFYREYDATLYNQGVLFANDALVQLGANAKYHSGHPTCPVEAGCSFIRTHNAKLVYWSPNKIVLQRTGSGGIALNMNNSDYYVINGKRNSSLRVTEPYKDFIIHDPSKVITLSVDPSLVNAL